MNKCLLPSSAQESIRHFWKFMRITEILACYTLLHFSNSFFYLAKNSNGNTAGKVKNYIVIYFLYFSFLFF